MSALRVGLPREEDQPYPRNTRWEDGTVEFLTLSVAASRKDCTRQAILRAIHAGMIDAQLIGTAYVVSVNQKWHWWRPQADPMPGTAVSPFLANTASPPSPATDRSEGIGES